MGDRSNLSEDAMQKRIDAAIERGEWYRALGLQNQLLCKRALALLRRQNLKIGRPAAEPGNNKYRTLFNQMAGIKGLYKRKPVPTDVICAIWILEALANLETSLANLVVRVQGDDEDVVALMAFTQHLKNIQNALAQMAFACDGLGVIKVLSSQYLKGDIDNLYGQFRQRKTNSTSGQRSGQVRLKRANADWRDVASTHIKKLRRSYPGWTQDRIAMEVVILMGNRARGLRQTKSFVSSMEKTGIIPRRKKAQTKQGKNARR